jgi:hypothetical protein
VLKNLTSKVSLGQEKGIITESRGFLDLDSCLRGLGVFGYVDRAKGWAALRDVGGNCDEKAWK